MNVSKRNNQRQLWADKEFIDWLMRLKGKMEAQGVRVGNLGEITRKIIKVENIDEIEKQVLKLQNLGDIKIKMDARRILG